MRILPVSSTAITEAVNLLRSGGVVAYPTETCYGFGVDLANPDAVRKLFALKRRPEDQPVSALFASIERAQEYVVWNDAAEALARAHLPGPLTIVAEFRAKEGGASVFPCPLSSTLCPAPLGLRVSSHPAAAALAAAYGLPIATTSANLHKHPEPYSAAEISRQFSDLPLQPDLVLDGGSLPRVPPSTIASIEGGRLRILRQGDVRVIPGPSASLGTGSDEE